MLVTALIAGGLGVLSTFLVMSSGPSQSDAMVACDAVEQIDFPLSEDDIDTNESLLWRLSGISGFATAAGTGDDAHSGFELPGQILDIGITRESVDAMNEALQRLSVECAKTSH